MIAGNSPWMVFSHKHHLVESRLPKYIPFTRVNHFVVLKFDIPATTDSLSPKSTTGNASTITHSIAQTVFSLQASTILPFAGLTYRNPIPTTNVSFTRPSVDGAMETDVHRHPAVMLGTSVDIVLDGGAEPLASYHSPFTGLNFDQLSESPESALATASAHEHAKVMSNLNTCHARVGASDEPHASGDVDGNV